MPSSRRPILALTQGDPAGVGPEILCKLLRRPDREGRWRPLVIAERVALESVPEVVQADLAERCLYLHGLPDRETLERLPRDRIPVVDPVSRSRRLRPGESGPDDAAGALAAIDAGVDAVESGAVDALVTAPVSKASIARHHRPGFRGHTEYLAERAGLERYGRDYLMTFLTVDLQVALLSTHVPLKEALLGVRRPEVEAALDLLHRHAGGRIAVAGINPHAGEGRLLGDEDAEEIRPAVEAARERGVDAHGPESPDSLFARARRGEFHWVLALYHDQGLIAVKTAAFGSATNWTLGLPYVRTSVDHGTAFGIAGRGQADARPLAQVVATTAALLAGELPRGSG